jgi:outer membrane protein
MLKKITLLLVICALPLGAMAQQKFGHVNTQEIIPLMPEFAQARTELEAMGKKYDEELQRSQEEFTRKYQELVQQADSLPRNILERRQKELQDIDQRNQQFQQEASQNMQQAQSDKMTPILQKLDAAIQAVGKAEGYLYIFDLGVASAIGRAPIPYIGSGSTDLTPRVKTELGIK